MSPTSRGLAALVSGSGKNVFRSRAKYLAALVFLTLACVWVLAILSLPDRGMLDEGNSMNKVYRVYKGIREASRDLVLPKPAIERPDNVPAVHHGILDKPDPHKEADLANLQAQMNLDNEVKNINYWVKNNDNRG
jgi:hypothetical protein